MILSIFNYCDIVYGPCLDAHTSMRIQKVQNSCVRFVFGLQCRDHTTPFIKDIKWLKMLNRRNLHLACFTHKVLVTSCPNYLSSKLLPRTYIHNKNLRYTNQLTTPQHTTALFQRSFSYQAVTVIFPVSVFYLLIAPELYLCVCVCVCVCVWAPTIPVSSSKGLPLGLLMTLRGVSRSDIKVV